MPGEHQGRAPEGRDGNAADDQLPLLADRYLAELREQDEGSGGRPRTPAARAGPGDPDSGPEAERSSAAAPLAPADREQVVQLVRAALAATDGLAELVGLLESRINAIAIDAGSVGGAMAQAMAATNERLEALERVVLPHGSPAAVAAEQALARLRLQLRETIGGAGSGPDAPGADPTPST